MSSFIAAAAGLVFLACALIGIPLLRRAGTHNAPAGGAASAAPRGDFGAALAAAALLSGGAAVLYATWSSWPWAAAPEAVGSAATGSPQQMVANLARRLERKPEDLDGWLMLGRSYAVLGQYPLAIRAYQRADRLASGRSAEALTGLAEALTLEDEAELAGRAGRLFEKALELDPRSGKALFFAAIAARRRGEPALARARFTDMLALDPPENVRSILEREIAELDRQLTGAPSAAAAR